MNNWAVRWKRIRQYPVTRAVILLGMTLFLIWIILSSIQVGAVDVSRDHIVKVTLDELSAKLHLGYASDLDYSDRFIRRDAALIVDIRWPRVMMAGLVGAGLALSGSALQGVFRNPLAEPGLIGVSSGAAVGAVTAIAAGLAVGPLSEDTTKIILAFSLGILTTFMVYRLAYSHRRTDTTTMILVGVAVNAIAASYVGLMSFRIGQEKIGDIVFWTLGSLGATDWNDVKITLPFISVGMVALFFVARPLNVMILGEAEARYLGVNVERLRLITIFLSALMTGVTVAFVGIVGFVGLVVPHILRILFGPDHRLLLPASVLGGAAFLIGMDVWARTIATPSEVPLGVMTTLIGGPFFLILVLVNHRRGVQL